MISFAKFFFASFAVLCELCVKEFSACVKKKYISAKLAKDRKARKADVNA